MAILKASIAIKAFAPYRTMLTENFNIKKFAESLVMGDHLNGGYHILKVQDRYDKYYYDSIPRMFKYTRSQKEFEGRGFLMEDFYDYGYSMDKIVIDYCKAFLNKYDNASVKRRLAKYKKSHPEYFI